MVEGVPELGLAVENGVQLHTLFIPEKYPPDGAAKLVVQRVRAQPQSIPVFSVSDQVFQSMCYRSNSKLVAIAHKHDRHLRELELADQAHIVICSSFENPGNLGAVMRSADAVGADAVIVESPVLDLFNPNVVRTSIGTLFTTPVVVTGFEALLTWLRQQAVSIVATSPNTATNYTNYAYPNRVAIVIGNETDGLHEQWFRHAHQVVTIPQYGQADSLNAAMSATVFMYEILRQRNAGSYR